jgi:hypothetical protein
MLPSVPERVIRFRVRTILAIFGLAIATWALLHIVSIARQVIVWILIALFLALAINPLVELLQRRGLRRRGIATSVAILLVLLGLAAVGALFIPTLVDNVNKFVDAVPGYVDDLTKGKGRFGFLETKYHVVEKVREQVQNGGAKRLLGLSGAAVSRHQERHQHRGWDDHDHLPDLLHAARRAGVGRALLRPALHRVADRWRKVGRDIYARSAAT